MSEVNEVRPSKGKLLIAWVALVLVAGIVAAGGRKLSSSVFPECGEYGSLSVRFSSPTTVEEAESILKFRNSELPSVEWSHPGPESWASSRTVKSYPMPPTNRGQFESYLASAVNHEQVTSVEDECRPRFKADGQLARHRPWAAWALESLWAVVFGVGANFIGRRIA